MSFKTLIKAVLGRPVSKIEIEPKSKTSVVPPNSLSQSSQVSSGSYVSMNESFGKENLHGMGQATDGNDVVHTAAKIPNYAARLSSSPHSIKVHGIKLASVDSVVPIRNGSAVSNVPVTPKTAPCQVCGHSAVLLDTVDLNKSCEELRGVKLSPSGMLIDYFLCDHCGFCFAPEMQAWGFDEFEKRIYNQEYGMVDPDYKFFRPDSNAKLLNKTFGFCKEKIRHLDYGGGSGLLSKTLRENGWTSETFDPFVDREKLIDDLGQFDFITAFEVFEHVPDVGALVDNLKKLCKPEGVILFSTILSDGNIFRSQKLTWWYASPRNGHISIFSRKSLEQTLVGHGLQYGALNGSIHVAYTQLPEWFDRAFQSNQGQTE